MKFTNVAVSTVSALALVSSALPLGGRSVALNDLHARQSSTSITNLGSTITAGLAPLISSLGVTTNPSAVQVTKRDLNYSCDIPLLDNSDDFIFASFTDPTVAFTRPSPIGTTIVNPPPPMTFKVMHLMHFSDN
ncbi:hypothetical protein A1F94_008389 [Pyrenophora tritici-repentis]|nr:hypothetical protein PtrV1_05970 [Pyrenophora tritici-repentis]KAF7450710.1 hypothetical protein A1F99_053260 [Pyrenophora tritici-repentis]KAG9381069.1 hypothetical protein A1F94_008389 [Pyrenophora tritici-repentis]KAI0582018.1 hypothetical protein Alg215_04374 [Pyrenophora tritici-repentis]KAI0609978.1 hypothetical protein TUN205_05792 [Pyrenophora tritici-repentis]